jgi:hypothetical protein
VIRSPQPASSQWTVRPSCPGEMGRFSVAARSGGSAAVIRASQRASRLAVGAGRACRLPVALRPDVAHANPKPSRQLCAFPLLQTNPR